MRGLLPLLAWSSALLAQSRLEFNRDVRPILSDKCFACHGPDAATKGVPVRLDVEEQAKSDRKGRRAIVPGRPEESTLVARITHERAALRMPPASFGRTLTPAEIETLKTWIAQGAEYQPHWAFLPPRRPALPRVKNPAWVRNPIDSFVLARLEQMGLSPSAPAAWPTLLRRVSLDLTGLPPEPAWLDEFEKAPSEAAYGRFVDRLLASRRYAERMTARWLDAARYADSNGYQFDGERVMWRWRDWVLEAFHSNKRYNDFLVEQLAGDLLPHPARDQIIATGFNRNHRANTEDGIIPDEYQVEYVVDRVETASTVFLGLTLGCARCHNHKYDPFSQKEFYRLFAYFNNIPENGRAMKYGNSPPLLPAPTAEQHAAHAALRQRIAAAERFLAAQEPAIQKGLTAFRPAGAAWIPRRALEFEAPSPALASEHPSAGQYEIDSRFSLSFRVRGGGDGALVTRMEDKPRGRGYGLFRKNGKLHVQFTSNFDDDAIRLSTRQPLDGARWQHVVLSYTGSRMAEGIALYVDGARAEVDIELDTLYRPFGNAGNRFRQPLRAGAGGGKDQRFTGELTDLLVYARPLEAMEIAVLAGRPEAADYARRRLYLETAAIDAVKSAWARLETLRAEEEALVRSFPTVMVMRELPERKPTHLLHRGEYNKKGEIVEPGVPAALPSLPAGAPPNRLGFAQWLVHPSHPLTSRVAVNRFWQSLFGLGLVKTVEDFGQQGEWPSHPELLDWLATEFVRTGWDIKALHRLIVTSAAYRQSSAASPGLAARDPENRWLARGPRFRLPAEMIRDQALFVSGLLKEKWGGPSVKPYQPAGLWKEIAMQDMDYVESKGDDLYRRGLYTFWKRTISPPMLTTFDAPSREACVVRELRTNTPLQALNLMNDITFLEAARFLGARMLLEGGMTDESRLARGFRLALARDAKAAELEVLAKSLQWHRVYFAQDPTRAARLLAQGVSRPDTRLSPPELAAYASVASLLLNLDEMLTKE